MVMIAWPRGDYGPLVECVVCGEVVHIERVTVGRIDARGRQAFACEQHVNLGELASWSRAWVDFGVRQDATTASIMLSEAQRVPYADDTKGS